MLRNSKGFSSVVKSRLCKHVRLFCAQSCVESQWWQMEQPRVSQAMISQLYEKHLEREFLKGEQGKSQASKKRNELIIWDGLQQLFDIKEFQGIKQYPSDIVWINKSKNLYLLEFFKSIEKKDWRQWLNHCYKMIYVANYKDWINETESIYYDMSRNGQFPYPKQKNEFYISKKNEEMIVKLTKFILSKMKNINNENLNQILKGKEMYEMTNLLENDEIFEQICKADINFNVYKRNKFLLMKGNGSLTQRLKYDSKFTKECIKYLIKLYDIDDNLCQKMIESLKNDIAFSQFTNNIFKDMSKSDESITKDDLSKQYTKLEKSISNDENDSNTSSADMYLWDDNKGEIIKLDSNFESSNFDVSNEDELLNQESKEGRLSIIYDEMRKYINYVPSIHRADSNLLRHSLEDCGKLVILDSMRLKEGYTGENGNSKWGLWRANGLPIVCLRPHMLELRDKILNQAFGEYIEIDGKYGSGKSVALMYCVSVARSANWLTIYCPDSHKWVEECTLTIPANDRDSVFYQHSFAKKFFENLILSESEKLKEIKLSDKWLKKEKTNENVDNIFDKKIDMDIVMQMLDDPIDIKRYESRIISEWMSMGSGNHGFEMDANSNGTLYDMIEYGCDENKCKYPASLLYDVMDEICHQRDFPVMIACDGIDYWNNVVLGLSTPRNPKVYAWQLSMVDVFSQFQQSNKLEHGIVVMSHTSSGKCARPGQFKTQPNDTILCPHCYTPQEFDTMMIHYQALRLSSPKVAPDDYKKIEGASARNPLSMQRLVSLF